MFYKLFFIGIILCSISFANPIDNMNELIIRLNEFHTEENQKHQQNIQTKINTLTEKSQSLFLLRQNNELLLNEQKIGVINGK